MGIINYGSSAVRRIGTPQIGTRRITLLVNGNTGMFVIPTSTNIPEATNINWNIFVDGKFKGNYSQQINTGSKNTGIEVVFSQTINPVEITICDNFPDDDPLNYENYGWANPFGFSNYTTGANSAANKSKLLEIKEFDIKAKSSLVSGLNNPLPAQGLFQYFCFNCTKLKKCVDITSRFDYYTQSTGALTVFNYLYLSAFSGCTSLIEANDIKNNVAGTSTYAAMFNNCSSLTRLPDITATDINGTNTFDSTFYGCTGATQISAIYAFGNASFSNYMFLSMFQNSNLKIWTSSGGSRTQFRLPTTGTATAGTNTFLNMFGPSRDGSVATPTVNTQYFIGTS